jgi:hypothetical protein
VSESVSTVTSFGFETTTETSTEQVYSILSNPEGYIALDSISTELTTTVFGIPTTSTSEETFSPAQNAGPGTRWCEGETWTTPAVTQTIVSDGETVYSGPSDTSNGVVQAVGESISTPAGSFSTIRSRVTLTSGDSAGGWVVRWLAMESSLMVRQEVHDPSGTLIGTFEAKEIH